MIGTAIAEAKVPVEAEATAIAKAIDDAKAAVEALTGGSTDENVVAAQGFIMTARAAITGAEHASAAETAATLGMLDEISRSLTTSQSGEERAAARACTLLSARRVDNEQ